MHWVISGSFGPTDPTRAMLPFLFAASAVQAGDSVTLMLFHDAVLMAVDGVGQDPRAGWPAQPPAQGHWRVPRASRNGHMLP